MNDPEYSKALFGVWIVLGVLGMSSIVFNSPRMFLATVACMALAAIMTLIEIAEWLWFRVISPHGIVRKD